jgi:UDP-N-acetylglucosamine--N-acetylmuramyl-(pentapeptide) pyrophosphoryl-undecaprenol N-acetylglucosamine transferase
MKNARILADRGGAILLPEGEDMGRKLYDAVTGLLKDKERQNQMSAALKNMVVLDSAEKICDIIQELAGNK